MILKSWKTAAVLGAAALTLTACGEGTGRDVASAKVTKDGTDKTVGGKGDQWDWRNDPARFHADLEYNWEKLPTEGYSKKTAWAETYWPTYEDSINARWQGRQTLSPAEKYDKAFNNWTPKDGFMDLKPYDPNTCEWDDDYYKSLGPAAEYVSKNKGNWKSHNGVDDDGDGLSDKDECGWGGKKDRDGVETWWGLCHAWVPSAILEDEPQKAVEKNGVKFEVSDLKALLIMQHDSTDAYMLGGRCNEKDVERDDTGRLTQDQCRDVNAGAFHVIVTNFLGKQQRAIAEDKTYDYQVWNQPVVGYKIDEQKEISLQEVKDMLGTTAPPDDNPMPETDAEVAGTLKVANEATFDELHDDVGLRSDRAQAVVDARTNNGAFTTIDDIDAVYGIGPRSIEHMLEFARNKGWAPQTPDKIYSYDENAQSFVEVRMGLDYVVEASPSTEPTGPNIDYYVRTDHYHYILELDGDGKIIGGEWVGSSRQSHPDFLWLPIRARGGDPHIDLDKVREMVAESRGTTVAENTTDFSNNDEVAIPDNDPNGADSVIKIDQDGTIKGLTVDVDIQHTYRGDLLVQLVNKDANVTVTVYDGAKVDNRWDDNVELTGETVSGFEGIALKGEWHLHVVDAAAADTGSIKSWTMHAEVE